MEPFDGRTVIAVGLALHELDTAETAATDSETDARAGLLLCGCGAKDGLDSLLGCRRLLFGRIEDQSLWFQASELDRVRRGGTVRLEAIVVSGRSRALEREGVLLLDSTIPMLSWSFPITIEVKYTASILVLVHNLLVHIHNAFFSEYFQLFLLLLGGVSDYYVVQTCLGRVLLLGELQIWRSRVFDLVILSKRAIRLVNLRKLHMRARRRLLFLGRVCVLHRRLQVLRLKLLDVGEVRLEALRRREELRIALGSSQVSRGCQIDCGLQLYLAGVDRLVMLIFCVYHQRVTAHVALLDRLVAVDHHLVVLERALEADR